MINGENESRSNIKKRKEKHGQATVWVGDKWLTAPEAESTSQVHILTSPFTFTLYQYLCKRHLSISFARMSF